jgi:rubredoxin
LAREMVWVERERFHGWACSVCAWVFNGSGPLVDKSIEEMKQRFETERDKEFRSHVCAEHPRDGHRN